MNFYYFNGGNHIENGKIEILEESGFTGVLFTYDLSSGDYFTKIARHMKEDQKIIYMVAIRPYNISPQYLTMINSSIQNIIPDRLQINLISGNIKENEKLFNGVIGKVNDLSNNIERSNFLIKYIEELYKLKTKPEENLKSPDCFISSTNKFVFNKAKELNQKVIISYWDFKNKYWTEYESYLSGEKTWLGEKINLSNIEVMIKITPIIRETKEELIKLSKEYEIKDTEYFTTEEFDQFIKDLKKKNINYLMLQPWPIEEDQFTIDYVKNFKKRFK